MVMTWMRYSLLLPVPYVGIWSFMLDLVHIYKFLYKYLLDPKDLLFDDALAFLCGNAGIDL
jgi:hypothetical protein